MDEAAKIISALSEMFWPLLFAAVLFFARREIRAILLQPGVEFALELAGNKISIKPTKPPTDKSPLPPVREEEKLPADYFYLNHTSFLRKELQEEFQRRTGVRDLEHYDIRVIVDSYYSGAMDRIEKVEYILHEAYPHPIQVRTNKNEKFLLKELANGEYVMFAKVYILRHQNPIVLQRYIGLWKDGPRLKIAS